MFDASYRVTWAVVLLVLGIVGGTVGHLASLS